MKEVIVKPIGGISLNTSFEEQPKNTYRFAVNAVVEEDNGELGSLTTERSNELVYTIDLGEEEDAGYRVIGSQYIDEENTLLFIANEVSGKDIISVFDGVTNNKVVQVYEARPLTDFTFSIPFTSLTSANNGTKIGSLALPQRFYVNGDRYLKSVFATCISGVGTASIAIKNYNSTKTTMTLDAAQGGSLINLGGANMSSNDFILYVEAIAITGTIEMLSITLSIQ